MKQEGKELNIVYLDIGEVQANDIDKSKAHNVSCIVFLDEESKFEMIAACIDIVPCSRIEAELIHTHTMQSKRGQSHQTISICYIKRNLLFLIQEHPSQTL